jgi:hypothetical protein
MIRRGDEFYHGHWVDEHSDNSPTYKIKFGLYPRQRCRVLRFANGMVFFVCVWFIEQQWRKSNVIFYFQAKKTTDHVNKWILPHENQRYRTFDFDSKL